jgi:hypothetical protein
MPNSNLLKKVKSSQKNVIGRKLLSRSNKNKKLNFPVTFSLILVTFFA